MTTFLIDSDVFADYFQKRSAELAGKLCYAYKSKGVSIPTVDTLIKDCPMPELQLYSFLPST